MPSLARFAKSQTAQSWGNPFRFANPSKSLKKSWLKTLFVSLMLTGGLLWWWILGGPNFALQQIILKTTLPLTPESLTNIFRTQLTKKRFLVARQTNLLTLDSRILEKSLKNQFIIEKVHLRKQLPHQLAVTIFEKPRQMSLISRGKIYALDAQGLVVNEGDQIKIDAQFPKVYSEENGIFQLGQRALAPKTVAAIARLWEAGVLQNFEPQFFILKKLQGKDLALKTKAGWKIWFAIGEDLKPQIDNLELILRTTLPPDKRKNLQYIDLRFGERVYFK